MKSTIIAVCITLILGMITIKIISAKTIEEIKNVKIIDLEQQQLIEKTGTEIRFLIITEKETFVCHSSWLNGKFSNSDLFYRLKKDSVYNFKVSGYGKGFFFDYRNVLEISK